MTPNDVCTNALKMIGACASSETPASDLLLDCYNRLNRMLDLWRTQTLTISGLQKFTLAVTAGHSPYTIGPSGDFNQARPVNANAVDRVTLALATNPAVDIPVAKISRDEYELIPAKTIQAQIAQAVYYNPVQAQNAASTLGELFFWPVLNDGSVTIGLWLPVALTQFTSQTQTLNLLPGYQAAIETSLARILLPEFGRIDPPTVAEIKEQARQAINWVKLANVSIPVYRSDPALLGSGRVSGIGGDWYAGP